MLVRDVGSVPRMHQRGDGSVHFYMRVAKVGKMPYVVWRDGKQEIIMRDVPESTLFAPESMASLAHTYLLDGHTTTRLASPDNLEQTIGVVGLPGREEAGDQLYLWALGWVNTRAGIEALKDKRQFSPEYDVILNKDKTRQLRRKYHAVALVDEARGGSDITLKDSADQSFCCADPDYWRSADQQRLWNMPPSEATETMITRLFDAGCLDPPPVIIPAKVIIPDTPKKNMQTYKIGNRTIKVDDESLADLIEASKEYDAAVSVSKDSASKDEKITQLTAEVAVLTKATTDLKAELANAPKALKDAMDKQFGQLKEAADDLKIFTADGKKPIPGAQDALEKQDLQGYITAVLADGGFAPDFSYAAYKQAFLKVADMAPAGGFVYAPTNQQNEYMGGAYAAPMRAGSIASLENPQFQQAPSGLTPDTAAEGWTMVGGM